MHICAFGVHPLFYLRQALPLRCRQQIVAKEPTGCRRSEPAESAAYNQDQVSLLPDAPSLAM
jgi:hypothetical protein